MSGTQQSFPLQARDDAHCWEPALQLKQRFKPRAKALSAKMGRGSRRRRSFSISLVESNDRAPWLELNTGGEMVAVLISDCHGVSSRVQRLHWLGRFVIRRDYHQLVAMGVDGGSGSVEEEGSANI